MIQQRDRPDSTALIFPSSIAARAPFPGQLHCVSGQVTPSLPACDSQSFATTPCSSETMGTEGHSL